MPEDRVITESPTFAAVVARVDALEDVIPGTPGPAGPAGPTGDVTPAALAAKTAAESAASGAQSLRDQADAARIAAETAKTDAQAAAASVPSATSLSNNTDSTKGAALIGYKGGTVADRLTSDFEGDKRPIGELVIGANRQASFREALRELGRPADRGAMSSELALSVGTRRNLWYYTEALGGAQYSVTNATKQTETIVVDGITLTRITATNFYGALSSNVEGLGLTPFTVGQTYLISYYVLGVSDAEQFVWMHDLVNGGSKAHGPKLITNRLRRVWRTAKAVTTAKLDDMSNPTVAAGAGVGSGPRWFTQGNTEGGALNIYVGGFQIESVGDTSYKDGVTLIGDSTMAGASAGVDISATNAREVSTYAAALLNVPFFNRAVGGERLDQMDARWATDITPLAVNSKYAVIQGGINDISQGRTLAQMQASVASMAAKATTDGMIPVLLTCTPTATIAGTTAYETLRGQFNTWLKQTYANVIDIDPVVADPHKPSLLRNDPDWYGDGTHYAPKAKRAVGAFVASWPGWEFKIPSPYQKIASATFTPPASALVHNGFQVVGPRGAAVADPAAITSVAATAAAAAPTMAEFNALVTEFNKLRTDATSVRTQLVATLAQLRAATGHGLIA